MKILKIITVSSLAICFPSLCSAQDLMAREATTDFQLKSSNAVKIIEQYQKKEESAMVANIYGDSWSNAGVNVYRNIARPEKVVIDMRDFSMPIKSRIVTSNYGYRKRFRRNHYGIDLKGYTGDTIYAAFSGKVRVRKYEGKGFGYYLVIRHPNGLETVYGHLSRQLVYENQEVRSGQPIGLCGNTGRSFGSHLHFETRVLGEPINPALLFNFQEEDIIADTYTHRFNTNTPMPIATPINSYAEGSKSTKTGNDGVTSEDENEQTNVAVSSKSTKKTKSRTKKHKVRQGENPTTIAHRYGISVSQLMKLNRGLNPTRLQPGQTIVVRK